MVSASYLQPRKFKSLVAFDVHPHNKANSSSFSLRRESPFHVPVRLPLNLSTMSLVGYDVHFHNKADPSSLIDVTNPLPMCQSDVSQLVDLALRPSAFIYLLMTIQSFDVNRTVGCPRSICSSLSNSIIPHLGCT
jgi:hypothetical protein